MSGEVVVDIHPEGSGNMTGEEISLAGLGRGGAEVPGVEDERRTVRFQELGELGGRDERRHVMNLIPAEKYEGCHEVHAAPVRA